MRARTENRLFNLLWKKYDLRLTLEELEEVEKIIQDEKIDYVNQFRERINWYRVVNVLVLSALLLICFSFGWAEALFIAVGLFILYNILHIVIINIRQLPWRKDKIRRLKNERNRRI